MYTSPPRVLAMVLAGGEGKRLLPLTAQRAKPAVPVAGHYRLVDFVLSNLANAGYTKIVVLTQYKSHSLDSHIAEAWRLSPILGHYVVPVPAQMRLGRRWFQGSADAIYQNLNIISDERPDYVCVFSADHIYRMDPRQMVDAHIESGAGVTVAAVRQPRNEAFRFGVIETDESGAITDFLEKPANAKGLADNPEQVLASMGNYVFSTDVLVEALRRDAKAGESGRDLGGDIIPNLVRESEATVYDFADNDIPGAQPRNAGYWRDVGTIDAYWDAHMDLIDPDPVLDLYNSLWPIHTGNTRMPPAKFVHDEKGRRGEAVSSLVCAGSIVSGGSVRRSVLSPGTFVHSYAEVDGSVVLHGVDVGRGAIVRHAIIDKGARIAPGATIGVDAAADEARFAVSEAGIVVVPKGAVVEAD